MTDDIKRYKVEKARTQGCRACLYFKSQVIMGQPAGFCRLNPTSTPVNDSHWCGQWVAKKPQGGVREA